jgi:hypothetical protein
MIADHVWFQGSACTAPEGVAGDGSTFDVTPEGRLRHAVTDQVRLPEEEWPTLPGDPWHGLVGTTKEVIIGWSPTVYSGPLRLVREADGRSIVLLFEEGKLRGTRVADGPASDPADGVAGSASVPTGSSEETDPW